MNQSKGGKQEMGTATKDIKHLDMEIEGRTTIGLSKELVNRLAKRGKKGETYEVIIERLLEKRGKR